MKSKKQIQNELTYKTEIVSQIENKYTVTKSETGGGINQEFGIKIHVPQIHTTIYEIHKQQEFTVQHRERYSVFRNNL